MAEITSNKHLEFDGIKFEVIIYSTGYDPERMHFDMNIPGVGGFPAEVLFNPYRGEKVVKFEYTCGDKEPVTYNHE